MAKASLLILAAGLGSRYGGGIKQLAKVGPSGEIIMDYSIHDAIKAGFDKIIFVIRHDIENDFREIIGNRIEKLCKKNNVEVCYAFQDINDLPAGHTPNGRTKPWGTGHAILSAKNYINEPFLVINADDFYGSESYVGAYNHLISMKSSTDYCMAGFILKNTLSDNGAVNRGVCKASNDGYLAKIKETLNIVKKGDKAFADNEELDVNGYVSMNMWGLSKEFVDYTDNKFTEFLDNMKNPMKDEYLLPNIVGSLIENKKATCKIIETNDKWLGVTYQEDKDTVIDAISNLVENKVYNKDLYSDL